MEINDQFDNLLIRYLSDEASESEKQAIVAWINADDRNRKYFEELTHTWRLSSLNKKMVNIDVDAEWNRFKQTLASKKAATLSQNDALLNEKEAIELYPERKLSVLNTIMKVAVAAAIISIVVVGLYWYIGNKTKQGTVKTVAKNSTPAAILQHQINNSGKDKKLLLEDGSEIILANQSELYYYEPFVDNKRDISLIGKATFHVAKDSKRPFTVASGDIATTALGTSFTVTSFDREDLITVQLFEGKVVIKSIEKARRKLDKDYFLLPGHEFIYNKKNHTALLRRFAHDKKGGLINPRKINSDNPSLPKEKTGAWYMFNNQPLTEVFEQLESMYQVDIVYDPLTISQIYFIGKFEKADSIEAILKKITFSNKLKLRREGNKFIVE